MIKIQIEMPATAGEKGLKEIELPTVPRAGEVIKDANNRYYKIGAVVYQPFEREGVPKVSLTVLLHVGTTPLEAL